MSNYTEPIVPSNDGDIDLATLVRLNDGLNIVVTVFLIVSIIGSFITALTFLVFSELRTYPIKLIVYLCISIMFAQLGFLLSGIQFDTIGCIPLAMMIHYFFLADFVWTFCVAFNFYQMIVRRNRSAEELEKRYHIFSWGLPGVFVVFLAGFQQYGNRGGFCYMAPGLPVFLAFFLPGLVVVSANCVIFFFIAREIHETLKSAPIADRREKFKEYRVYFSIFASIGVSWIFGFIMTFAQSRLAYAIFLVLFSIFTPLQGFLLFISYCINKKVMLKWMGLFAKVFPCLRVFEGKHASTTSSTTSASNTNTSSNSGSFYGGKSGRSRSETPSGLASNTVSSSASASSEFNSHGGDEFSSHGGDCML
eukprot:TRINITY_DN362_c0_g1_i3.p1 TRINITY_DN362_c0_g1~~TRINITY_DN362_c0_g1_i3.p1  ORF type:complete len:364 (-),score=74.40 TRINITY_DN362_c0_g1_i3:44-1135(-)